jgi:rare lipoprotein A
MFGGFRAIRRSASRVSFTVSLVFIAVFTSSCSSRRATVVTPRVGAVERGIASWYGPGYHGRPTASGETYDMDHFTAAHRRFAFGTRVRVHNLDNGRSTQVRINDRGPFKKGRIIDLSRAAARDLDMVRPGTARVRVVVVAKP